MGKVENFKKAFKSEGLACSDVEVLTDLVTRLCLWTTAEVKSADATKTNKVTQTPNDSEMSTNKS